VFKVATNHFMSFFCFVHIALCWFFCVQIGSYKLKSMWCICVFFILILNKNPNFLICRLVSKIVMFQDSLLCQEAIVSCYNC
jgi:hypothetical protein